MKSHYFARVLIACVTVGVCILPAHNAQARRPWRSARVVPVEPVPVQPVPVQPVPVQPVPDTSLVPQPAQIAPENAAAPASAAARGAGGRLIYGRNLIGMTIWGGNHERLGTVKDFVVDYQGDCPNLFFAMAPEISGWNQGYVIVPFQSLQVGYDEGQRTDYFVLGVAVDDLRRAPHLEIDRWTSIRDRKFFTDAGQFFRRVERTATRPESGTGRDGRGRSEAETRQPSDRPTPVPPRTPSPSGSAPGSRRDPGARSQAPPAPTAPAPGAASPKSDAGPSQPKSAPDKPVARPDSDESPEAAPPAPAPGTAPPKSNADPDKRKSDADK